LYSSVQVAPPTCFSICMPSLGRSFVNDGVQGPIYVGVALQNNKYLLLDARLVGLHTVQSV